jgi:hypothetical protein
MGTGQFLYIIIALMALMSLTMSMYKLQVHNLENVIENQLRVNAISLSEAIIEEVWTKYFDKIVVPGATNNEISAPTSFTSTAQLGAEAGEVYPNFNDIDDFNNWSQDILFGADYLTVDAKVVYARRDGSNNLVETSNKSLMKKLILKISGMNGRVVYQTEYYYPYLLSN